ncbi:MAG: protease, partial [Brevundimonas sp.]
FYVRPGRGKDNKNAGPLILIGLAIAAVGTVLAVLIRLSLSRTREYVADAGAVELTKNPDAMISALRKIDGHSTLEAPDEVRGMFLDNQAKGSGLDGLFSTHPPIEKRIAALIQFAGGIDNGPWGDLEAGPVGTAVPMTTSTSVPTT